MGVGILISSYHCTWEFWYLLTIVHTQRLSEVPRGWDFFLSSYHCTHSRPIWSSTGVEILISSYHCTHSRSIWSSMGVGILISSEHCTHSKVNWKFHGRAFFSYLLPTIVHTQRWITQRWIWSSMGVGILISSYHCTLKGQCEVPWGWEFRRLLNYHCTHAKVNLKVHEGGNFGIFLPLRKLKVNLKLHGGGNFDIVLPLHTQRSSWSSMGVGNLISSYWCTHSMSIWSSMGVGFFYIFLPLYTLKGLSEVPRGGIFDIFLPLYTFKVNLKFHGVGFGYLLTLVHIQGQFEVHGVSQGSACDHREGVRSCAIRRPALHKRSCTIREVAYLQSGWCRIAQLDIQCIRKGQGVQWMLNVMLHGLRWK